MWSSEAYSTLSASYATKSTAEIFTSRGIDPLMDPTGLLFRECRDSGVNPETLAIIFALDVTGSMGVVPEHLVRHKLGSLIETLIAHGIPSPQVCFLAVGDHLSDSAPLQVGQFEAGTVELNQWLTKAYLEGGGGGGNHESYLLAYLFGGRHTSIDCYEKRGQKGFLFTTGDERSHTDVDAANLKKILGYGQSEDLTFDQLLMEAQKTYHVFHIHCNETMYRNNSDVFDFWKGKLGQNFIVLDDQNVIAETVASTVAVMHGLDLKEITKTFDSKTALSVEKALVHVSQEVAKRPSEGVMTL
jgi:hypothetical protein